MSRRRIREFVKRYNFQILPVLLVLDILLGALDYLLLELLRQGPPLDFPSPLLYSGLCYVHFYRCVQILQLAVANQFSLLQIILVLFKRCLHYIL